MPKPRAMPLTSWVLPAPRSPDNAMTNPVFAARPQASPRDSVSAGLCEMFVAMESHRASAGFVAERDAFAGRDFADARQREFGKLLFPGVQHRNGVLARHGEQEFKILAIGERRQQGSF